MLQLDRVETAYGSSQVLFGIDLSMGAGEAISLMGRNGMGKTTTVRSIMGLTPPCSGEIHFQGRLISGRPPFAIARSGIGLVPEGRRIFPNLSVRENLVAAARRGHWTLSRIYDMFPRLQERERNMGTQLSGGEQQMLAIGRALMTNPQLLILDEATEGLAPAIRSDIWQCLRRLRQQGQSLLIIDHQLDALLQLCDRHYILDKGRIAWSGNSSAFHADLEQVQGYLTV
jgi:branched-chain amino acid transport system ATP-binding protein